MQPTLFGSLNTGYSGLQESQLQVATTSNNISNADTAGYSRQAAIVQNAKPLNSIPGEVGLGVQVKTIMRAHDKYIYDRLLSATMNKEFTGFQSDTLQEVSQYVPNMQKDVGISSDLTKFFNAWQNYANAPGDTNQAISVTQQTLTLSSDIQQTYTNVQNMQKSLNAQVPAIVDQINALGATIADLNKQINNIEAGGLEQANDLKDQRDNNLLTLNGLVNISTSQGIIATTSSTGATGDPIPNYVVQIGGYPLVDGAAFHPLTYKTDPNSASQAFTSVYFQRQDYVEINITDKLQGGKLGAILNLRGTNIGSDGLPQNGEIQGYLNSLNTFATGLSQNVNNLYAGSAMPSTISNTVNDTTGNQTLTSLGMNISNGTFNYTVYDTKGKAIATRPISINPDVDTMNTVVAKFNAAIDDNLDGNSKDDTNSFFQASFVPGQYGQFQINPTTSAQGQGYTFAITDSTSSPTNFAGALGLNRVFDGTNASTISLAANLAVTPTDLHAYSAPIVGNNDISNSILNLQYNNVTFHNKDKSTTSATVQGFYNDLSTKINADTSAAISSNTTVTTVLNAVVTQNQSVSQVSVDQELVNLMRFQSSYSANAKVISTIDQMIQVLLGIKQ